MADKDLSMEEWADMIDEARERQAYGDLSAIAYRMLTVNIGLNAEKDGPFYLAFRKSLAGADV